MKPIVKMTDLYDYLKMDMDTLIKRHLSAGTVLKQFELTDITPVDGVTFNIHGNITLEVDLYLIDDDVKMRCLVESKQLSEYTPIQVHQSKKEMGISIYQKDVSEIIKDIRVINAPEHLDENIVNYFLKHRPIDQLIDGGSQSNIIVGHGSQKIKDIIITI